jgi:DNA-binding NarL/FixJ family response regulator
MVKYRILTADYSPCYQEGMKISLKKLSVDINITTSNTISKLIQSLIFYRYNLIILDFSLIKKDNIDILSNLIYKNRTKTLLLFDEQNSETRKIEKAINCCGMLKKNADSFEFNSAVMTLLQGGFYFPAYPETKLKVSPLSQEELSLLTAKELNVLELLTEGGLNKQIADQLNITEDTVKAHVSNILKKLHLPNRTSLAIAHFRAACSTRNQPIR